MTSPIDETFFHSQFPELNGLRQALSQKIGSGHSTIEWLRSSDYLICAMDASNSQSGRLETLGLLTARPADCLNWWHGPLKAWRRNRKNSYAYKKIRSSESHLDDLNQFCRAADQLPGLLTTLSIGTYSVSPITQPHEVRGFEHLDRFRNWPNKLWERLIRWASLLAVTLSHVYRPGQQVYWFCDNDELFANEERKDASMRFVAGYLAAHLSDEIKLIFGLPGDDEWRLFAEDILAVSDVAAGGIGDSLDEMFATYGTHGLGVALNCPEHVKDKAQEIHAWFGMPTVRLEKTSLSLDTRDPSSCLAMLNDLSVVPKLLLPARRIL